MYLYRKNLEYVAYKNGQIRWKDNEGVDSQMGVRWGTCSHITTLVSSILSFCLLPYLSVRSGETCLSRTEENYSLMWHQ